MLTSDTETAWRKGLAAKGRDCVLAELRMRAGRPSDPLLDIVYEGPDPTREFCERWCVEQDNRIISVSATTIATIATFVVLVCVVWLAASSLANYQPPRQPQHASATSGQSEGGGDSVDGR